MGEYYEKEEKSYESNCCCDYCSAYVAAYRMHQSSNPFKDGKELAFTVRTDG